MSGRLIVLSLVVAALALAAVTPASGTAADVPSGTYDVNLRGGTMHIGTPSPMDFSFAPALLGRVDVPAGDEVPIRLPVAGQSLSPVTSPTVFGPVTFTVTFTEDLIGTLTRSTGALNVRSGLMLSDRVGDQTGFICAQGSPTNPITLELSTLAPGSPLDSALTATVADNRFALPALRDCIGIDTTLANVTGGFPVAPGASNARIMISLVNTATVPPPVPNPAPNPAPAPAPTPSPGGTRPPPVTGVAPRLTAAGMTATVRNGQASVQLRCVTAAKQCTGQLQLLPAGAGPALSKHVRFAIAAGHSAKVLVRLRHAALVRLRRRGSLRARATLTIDGATKRVTRNLVLHLKSG